jgi:hypothetical protein
MALGTLQATSAHIMCGVIKGSFAKWAGRSPNVAKYQSKGNKILDKKKNLGRNFN